MKQIGFHIPIGASSKVLLLFMMCMCLLTSCGDGRGDWKYALPNGYTVFRVNSGHIVISGEEYRDVDEFTCSTTYVENYVAAFCYNNRYVGAMQIECEGYSLKESERDKPPVYYILDTENGTIYGSFLSEDEYLHTCDVLKISNMSEWIQTDDLNYTNAPS